MYICVMSRMSRYLSVTVIYYDGERKLRKGERFIHIEICNT